MATSPQLHPAEDYDFLRSEGLAHIQRLSGRLWTDHNIHDPGITILELVAFAVADLGFRTGHPIADLLQPTDQVEANLKQFYSLVEVAGTYPWSVTDYRKLLIDLPGVANAWLSRANGQEVRIYLDLETGAYTTRGRSMTGQEEIVLNGLYEVALRFEQDAQWGDLNDNSMQFWAEVSQPGGSRLVEFEVEFPFYSRLPKRLQDLQLVLGQMEEITEAHWGPIPGESYAWYLTLYFQENGNEEDVTPYEKEFRVELRLLQPAGEGLNQAELYSSIFSNAWWQQVLTAHYLPRRVHIEAQLKAARDLLLQYRNLGEDYLRFVAMDLQEVAVEMEVEVRPEHSLEQVELGIYQALQAYLEPPLRFHSLEEMLAKGYTSDRIFDGPLLQNGFLEPAQLQVSHRRKAVHSSDLVQLFMAVPGVVAVRNLRMHNRIAGDVVAANVADSLRLTAPGRFQPVCDARRCKLKFYQGSIPVHPTALPDRIALLKRFKASVMGNVAFKHAYTVSEPVVASGAVRNISTYTSLQDDFPQAWGVGRHGLPLEADAARKAKAQQLKAYLMFFEQVMCNYLAQLQQVKRLLSVGAAEEMRTYFSKVASSVPGLDTLLLDPEEFPVRLEALVESPEMESDRRNRLLDHLLGRFNTSLVDVATFSFKRGLVSNAQHWIAAKAHFVQQLPSLTGNRAGTFDFRDRDSAWESGFLYRLQALMGWAVEGPSSDILLIENILLRPRVAVKPIITGIGQNGELSTEPRNDMLGARLEAYRRWPYRIDYEVHDPWSCRLTLVLPHTGGHSSLADPEWRWWIQRRVREELPAHILVEFLWLDNVQHGSCQTKYRNWRTALRRYEEEGTDTRKEAWLTAVAELSEELNMGRNLFGAIYHVHPAKKLTFYQDNETLAEVMDREGKIVKAWLEVPGLPMFRSYSESSTLIRLDGGLALDEETGRIYVYGTDYLEPVNLNLRIYTMNQAGGITFHSLQLVVLADKAPELRVSAPLYDWQYKPDHLMATVVDEDSEIVEITWAGETALPSMLRLDQAAMAIRLNGSGGMETWMDGLQAAPTGTYTFPVRLEVRNRDGLTAIVSGDLVGYRSHLAIATPHPEMGASKSMSYFAGGRYLLEVSDADGGIEQLKNMSDPRYAMATWGLSARYGTAPVVAELYISNFQLFKTAFEQNQTVSGNTVSSTYRFIGRDIHGQETLLTNTLTFSIDHGATWEPILVSGTQSQYAQGVLLGNLRDVDDGIVQRPTVGGLDTLALADAMGLMFTQVSGPSSYYELKIALPGKFGLYANTFTMNTGKTSKSGQFVAQSVDGRGGVSETSIMLTVLDSPVTAVRNTKFDTLRRFTEIVAGTDVLYTLSDTVDGGIVSVRDVAGRAWTTSAGLSWSLTGGVISLRVSTLTTFYTYFKSVAVVNTTLGRYDGTIQVIVTDGAGFERTVSLALFFRIEVSTTWTPTLTSGTLGSFQALVPMGYLADLDGGISGTPTVLSPSSTVWASMGLRFTRTTETTPRQALEIYNLVQFREYVRTQMTKDTVNLRAYSSLVVRSVDALGTITNSGISLQVFNTAATFRPNDTLIDSKLVGAVQQGNWLLEFADDTDLGVAAVVPNDTALSFAEWGLEVDMVTVPGKALLVVRYPDTFKVKFETTPKDDVVGNLEGKRFAVLVTDRLGFATALTASIRFPKDTESQWQQAISSAPESGYPNGAVIGTFTDADNGIASVTLHNANAGLRIDPNPSNSLRKDLVVANTATFLNLFTLDNISGNYYYQLSATTTDGYGGTTQHSIQMIVLSATPNQPPRVVPSTYNNGTKRFAELYAYQVLGTIDDVADGGLLMMQSDPISPSFSSRGIAATLNGSTKVASFSIADLTLFRNTVVAANNKVGDVWQYDFNVWLSDARGQAAVVTFPVRVLDTPATATVFSLPQLSACTTGTSIAMISEPNDGGVRGFRVISAPNLVLSTPDSPMILGLEGSNLILRVGSPTAFVQFVMSYWGKSVGSTVATYSMVIETTDQNEGISTTTLNLSVNIGQPSVSASLFPAVSVPNLRANEPLATLNLSGYYDFVSVDTSAAPLLADMGLQVIVLDNKTAQLEIANLRTLNRVIFEGGFRLDSKRMQFSRDLTLRATLSHGQTISLSLRLVFLAGTMSRVEYYADVAVLTLNVDVASADGVAYPVNLAALIMSPTSGSFSYTGLQSGVKATYTKPSTFDFRLDFMSGFFSGGTPIYFTGSCYYGGQVTRRQSFRVNFYPKP